MRIDWGKILRFCFKFSGYSFLVLWLLMLLVVDFASFPDYMRVMERLQKVEQLTGSIVVPHFKEDGSVVTQEYVAASVVPMSSDKVGSDIYFVVFINKKDMKKFIEYDIKGGRR